MKWNEMELQRLKTATTKLFNIFQWAWQCIGKKYDSIHSRWSTNTNTHTFTHRLNIKTVNYALIINNFISIFTSLNAYTSHPYNFPLNCTLQTSHSIDWPDSNGGYTCQTLTCHELVYFDRLKFITTKFGTSSGRYTLESADDDTVMFGNSKLWRRPQGFPKHFSKHHKSWNFHTPHSIDQCQTRHICLASINCIRWNTPDKDTLATELAQFKHNLHSYCITPWRNKWNKQMGATEYALDNKMPIENLWQFIRVSNFEHQFPPLIAVLHPCQCNVKIELFSGSNPDFIATA